MQNSAKWTIGMLASLILATPLALGIWIWTGVHRAAAKKKREATELIARFHQSFNLGDVDSICTDTFTCSGPERAREIWQPTLDNLKSRCGKFENVVKANIDVYVEPASVQAQYVSSFEKGQLREVFVMKDIDDRIDLVSYGPVRKVTKTGNKGQCGDE